MEQAALFSTPSGSSIAAGTITALLGPNGCGKSTLFKALAPLIPISGGAALLDGKAIHKTSSREIARAMAIHADGTPGAVLTSAMLKAVFDVEATIVADPVTGRPAFFPGRRPVAADAADDYCDDAPIGIADISNIPDITAEPDGAPRRVQRHPR